MCGLASLAFIPACLKVLHWPHLPGFLFTNVSTCSLALHFVAFLSLPYLVYMASPSLASL